MLCVLRTSSTSCGGACRFPIARSRLQALDAGRSPLPPRDAPGPRSPSQTLHVSCIHGLPRKDRLGIRHEKSLGVFLAVVPGNVRIGLAQSRRSEEHTSELQSLTNLVCRLLLEK